MHLFATCMCNAQDPSGFEITKLNEIVCLCCLSNMVFSSAAVETVSWNLSTTTNAFV